MTHYYTEYISTLLRIIRCELSPHKLCFENTLKERRNPSVKGPKVSQFRVHFGGDTDTKENFKQASVPILQLYSLYHSG